MRLRGAFTISAVPSQAQATPAMPISKVAPANPSHGAVPCGIPSDVIPDLLHPVREPRAPCVLQSKQGSVHPSNSSVGTLVPSANLVCHVSDDLAVCDPKPTKFFSFSETDEISSKTAIPTKEEVVEKHFKSTTPMEPSGRFCVPLPLVNSPPDTGSSRKVCQEKKMLGRRPDFPKTYVEAIQEYKATGHFIPANRHPRAMLLLHYGVLKLRIVFDGGTHASNSHGHNRNKELQTCSMTQPDLFDILGRFRQTHPVALPANIEQMYRQVNNSKSSAVRPTPVSSASAGPTPAGLRRRSQRLTNRKCVVSCVMPCED